jgi:hypothetical protein
MSVYENFAGALTIGQQVLTGFDESGRLVVFAQTTNPDYIPNTAGAISTYNIADAAITRDHILENAIDRTRIAQGEVTAALIAVDAIDATHISPEAITAPAIAANAIVGYHIVANSISASHISAYSITAEEIAANTITADRILSRTITADRIGVGEITATEIAANTITAAEIEAGSLTSASGVFGDISADDITTGSLSADRISGGTISAETIILAGSTLSSLNYDGNFDGASGWSFQGGTAVLNDVIIRGTLSGVDGTFSGNLSGGTIDIGGSDTSSFHVDDAGNMWLGAATYAAAESTFRVSSSGDAQCATLRVGEWGRVSVFNTNSMRVGATGTGAARGALELLGYDGISILSDVAPVRITAGGSIQVSQLLGHIGQSIHIDFRDSLGTRLGYIGYPGNDDIWVRNEASSGLVYIATNSEARITVSPSGTVTIGSTTSPTESQFRVYADWPSTNAAIIWNQAGTFTDSPKGLDIYLGASGAVNDPQNDDDFIRFRRGDGSVVGQIDGDGAGGVRYHPNSDRKLKTKITKDLSEAVDAFDQIPWRSFVWKATDQPAAGVIAQELHKVPRWAYTVSVGGKFKEPDPDTGKMRTYYKNWGVDHVPFIGVIAAKVRSLEARIEQLEAAAR